MGGVNAQNSLKLPKTVSLVLFALENPLLPAFDPLGAYLVLRLRLTAGRNQGGGGIPETLPASPGLLWRSRPTRGAGNASGNTRCTRELLWPYRHSASSLGYRLKKHKDLLNKVTPVLGRRDDGRRVRIARSRSIRDWYVLDEEREGCLRARPRLSASVTFE